VSPAVSEAFGMPIVVDRVNGRWFARRASE